jgi:hypothetical protein
VSRQTSGLIIIGGPFQSGIDNGSVYIAKQFAWILGELKTAKLHHKPYQAYCKGKVEAVNKTIKNDFQGEAQRAGFQTLEELNSAFAAWVDLEYNVRIHSTTGEAPDKRFADALHKDIRRVADIAWFEALFLMRVSRTVTKYGKIKLESNEYPVTLTPHGCVIEVRYDPFDLRKVFIFKNGTSASKRLRLEARPENRDHCPRGIEGSRHARSASRSGLFPGPPRAAPENALRKSLARLLLKALALRMPE